MMRRLLLVVTVVVADAECWRWCTPERRPPGETGLAGMLVLGASWLLPIALTWLAALLVLTAIEPLLGPDLCHRLLGCLGAPAWLRPAVLTLVGATAAAGLATPAVAVVPRGHGGDPARPVPVAGSVSGLPVPDRPDRPHAVRTHRTDVVVAPGDSLWRIAARGLPGDASAAEVTAGWHRLYARNRARIGDDPDLIRTGTRLVRPGPHPTHQETP